MVPSRLRRQIALEAARLIYVDQESEYYRAKLQAARRLCQGLVTPGDLPSTREIRKELHAIRRSSSLDTDAGSRSSHRGHATGAERFSSLWSETERWASAAHDGAAASDSYDRFRVYHLLLAPLEEVKQNPKYHPEGDVLYHSLQVFDLARGAVDYDEEFQLAALLHDVGKAIEPRDHVAAGLEALAGHITPRTAWLIEHQPHAAARREGSLGARSRRRLEANESFDDLMLLHECDRRGRVCGAAVPDLEDALDHVRELARLCDDE
ncbi:MAG TPA: HD domain-containing protein [Pirellulales bacterium]|nr:HD domain-containing protein [Pirellulales bacterium]